MRRSRSRAQPRPPIIIPGAEHAGKANPRLAAVIDHYRESYTGLSQMLGRPKTYLGEHVRRGRPARLTAAEIDSLARYLGVLPEDIGEAA
ncbi:hypothetical protein [Sphingomonas sanxanigenens]|uniref:HTH cro/C1-type domain-containing protein n=1 Tax=Sphingomonas sanxanigenens DSM 19645 = NX02 TaxID=1123269 RepID=W0AHJ3_9SPHN|nr:hypothetical protein [Sphingomonas sanxanigenens]AHE55987.1 hypothetical protein NX02_21785 [Sphingomonas sanxanigenens DSM 19645 = NX02]